MQCQTKKDYAIEQSVKINFADNAQHEKTLYLGLNKAIEANMFELPPVPFADMFDIRFANNSLLETSESPVIKLTGVEYPLAISIDDPVNEYTFVDAITGQVLGTISPSNKTLVVNNSSNAIRVLVSSVESGSTLMVYPNPVTSTAILRYNLAEQGNVYLAMYDALGNEVKTFANGLVSAGEHTLTVNANDFPSGQYLLKLRVGDQTKVVVVNIVK